MWLDESDINRLLVVADLENTGWISKIDELFHSEVLAMQLIIAGMTMISYSN